MSRSLYLPSSVRPSYKQGFARSAAQSSAPGLWPDHAWVPALGSQGTSITKDVAGVEHGTLTSISAADVVIDKGVTTISYDGVSDYSTFTTLGDFGTHRRRCTMVMLVKTTDTSDQWVYGERAGDNAQRFDCRFGHDGISAGTGRMSLFNYGTVSQNLRVYTSTDTGVTDGEWHSVAVVWNVPDAAYDIYVDGVSVGASSFGTAPTSPLNLAAPLMLGAFNNGGSPLTPFAGEVASFSLYSRALQPTEIRQLYRDSLSPFRLRRFTPTYSPVAEAAATTSVGWTRSLTPSPVRPSYKSGFARSAAESSSPGLWKGLVGAWCVSLGHTGTTTVPDVSGNSRPCILSNIDSGDLVHGRYGAALDMTPDGEHGHVVSSGTPLKPGTGDMSWSFWANMDTATDNEDFVADRLLGGGGSQEGWVIGKSGNTTSGKLVVFLEMSDNSFKNYNKTPAWTVAEGWFQFVVTWCNASDELLLYKNGVNVSWTAKVTDNSLTGKSCNNPQDTRVYGGRPGTNARDVNGRMNNTMIWSRAIQPSEIRQLYRDPLAPFRLRQRLPAFSVGEAEAGGWQPYWGWQSTRTVGVLP